MFFAGHGIAVPVFVSVGEWFLLRFLWASYYIPAYLIFCATYLLLPHFNRKVIYVLMATIAPFLTLAAFLRVLLWTRGLKYFVAVLICMALLIELYGIAVIAGFKGFRFRLPSFSFKMPRFDLAKLNPFKRDDDEEEDDEDEEFIEEERIDAVAKEIKAEPAAAKSTEEDDVYTPEYLSLGLNRLSEPDEQVRFNDEEEPVIELEPEVVSEPEQDDEPEESFDDDSEISIEIEDDEEETPAPKPVRKPSPAPRRKAVKYEIPIENVLEDHGDSSNFVVTEETKEDARILLETLKEFKIEAQIISIKKGPVITMFEILPASGVNVSKIANLAGNIALNLAAQSVRIVAPIPGKRAVGVEIPNQKRNIVGFRELIAIKNPDLDKAAVPFILGRDIEGDPQVVDVAKTPHLLIAGTTGSGKSVCVNSLISTILYKKRPDEVKMILVDPKVVELKIYNDVPHLLTPVITDPKKALQALQYCIDEMERRYALLDQLKVRNIEGFNKAIKTSDFLADPLPYILVVIDEFADLMLTSSKQLEPAVSRLTAKARAVGIHLVLATQRPSVDVITGVIKSNIPSRIAFMVSSYTDSRVILDEPGAEMLLGKGDMLFKPSWSPNLTRIQSAFLSDDEVERLVSEVKKMGEPEYIDDIIFHDDEEESMDLSFGGGSMGGGADNDANLMDKALAVVAETGKASASYLQRRLSIGYNRAARLIEDMEARGIIGPPNGSKPREIIHLPDKFKD
ncbi:MAG: DNA translocase FtsK [Spirochaetia bacterium]|nr:DNA translocase FtsK [Spirochaetia bacterium]